MNVARNFVVFFTKYGLTYFQNYSLVQRFLTPHTNPITKFARTTVLPLLVSIYTELCMQI